MKSKTFKEWSALGYRILKGSKSAGKNSKGEHIFTEKQVWHPEDQAFANAFDNGDDLDMDPNELADHFGLELYDTF